MTEPVELSDILQGRVRLLWAQACNWEGVHPRSSFVVFSPDNPYQEEYSQAYREYRASLEKSKEE